MMCPQLGASLEVLAYGAAYMMGFIGLAVVARALGLKDLLWKKYASRERDIPSSR